MGLRPRCAALALGLVFVGVVACTGEPTRGPSCINPQPDLPFCGSPGPGNNGKGGGVPVNGENPGDSDPNPPLSLGGSFATGGGTMTAGTGFGTGGGMATGGTGAGQPSNGAGGSAQAGASEGGAGGEGPAQGGASGGDAEGGAAGDGGGGAGGDGG
jgi:hypothetical protein